MLSNKSDYLNGIQSSLWTDITICAFESEFNLHKIILSRNDYFHCLINKHFAESNLDYISLSFDQDLITKSSFEAIIHHLYGRHLKISNANFLSLAATASYFCDMQIMNQILAFIKTDISVHNVLEYYNLAVEYPFFDEVLPIVSFFLSLNSSKNPGLLLDVLAEIEESLFRKIVSGDFFFVGDEEERFELVFDVLWRREEIRTLELFDDLWLEFELFSNFVSDDSDILGFLLLMNTIKGTDLVYETIKIRNEYIWESQILERSLPKASEDFLEEAIIFSNLSTKKLSEISIKSPSLNQIINKASSQKFLTKSKIKLQNPSIPTLDIGDNRKILGHDSNSFSASFDPLFQGPSISLKKKGNYCNFAARFGVEFENLQGLQKGKPVYSKLHNFFGSYWCIMLEKFILPKDDRMRLGIYLQLCRPPTTTTTTAVSYYDKRLEIKAWCTVNAAVVWRDDRPAWDDEESFSRFRISPHLFFNLFEGVKKHGQHTSWGKSKVLKKVLKAGMVKYVKQLRVCVVIGLL